MNSSCLWKRMAMKWEDQIPEQLLIFSLLLQDVELHRHARETLWKVQYGSNVTIWTVINLHFPIPNCCLMMFIISIAESKKNTQATFVAVAFIICKHYLLIFHEWVGISTWVNAVHRIGLSFSIRWHQIPCHQSFRTLWDTRRGCWEHNTGPMQEQQLISRNCWAISTFLLIYLKTER